tara:strand:- start:296 stop:1312 length:1017 start_codon:yes stop_codon:yes gene_type:complete
MSDAEHRTVAMDAFLGRHGFAAADRSAPSADASFRRYFRLTGGPYPALLMDAPPDKEKLRPFVEIAAHLRRLGLSAPNVPASDMTEGFALVEDFGDATFTRLLDDGVSAETLYGQAIDALAALQNYPENADISLPPYDLAFFLKETGLFLDWYWPAARGSGPSAAEREEFQTALTQALIPVLARSPRVFVHRDFHVDNLIVVEGRTGVAACGLLDFQDALIGPPAYDLVSLLQDERRDVASGLAAAMRARYAKAVPALADDTAYWVLGAQRHLKNLGIFARLSRRDGKHRYLAHVPRMWRMIDECLAAEPILAPLAAWLDANWPSHTRIALPAPGLTA